MDSTAVYNTVTIPVSKSPKSADREATAVYYLMAAHKILGRRRVKIAHIAECLRLSDLKVRRALNRLYVDYYLLPGDGGCYVLPED
jgi:hypothetical protein